MRNNTIVVDTAGTYDYDCRATTKRRVAAWMEPVQPIRERKDIETMKQILRASNLRDYCLFVLGINSGLRIGDLLLLYVKVVVDQDGGVKERIHLREQKTGKGKDFPLNSNATEAIYEYLSERTDLHLNEPLFQSQKGKGAITSQHAWRVINGAARKAGIKDRIGTHTLRKTFGYQAYKSGVDVTRIQKLLNHSSPFITLAYIGTTQDELDKIYIELDL